LLCSTFCSYVQQFDAVTMVTTRSLTKCSWITNIDTHAEAHVKKLFIHLLKNSIYIQAKTQQKKRKLKSEFINLVMV